MCGSKQSVAKGREVKLEVHHKRSPNWQRIFEVIREELLVDPVELECMCKECHGKHHEQERDVGVHTEP